MVMSEILPFFPQSDRLRLALDADSSSVVVKHVHV